jgi:hypothetical protein
VLLVGKACALDTQPTTAPCRVRTSRQTDTTMTHLRHGGDPWRLAMHATGTKTRTDPRRTSHMRCTGYMLAHALGSAAQEAKHEGHHRLLHPGMPSTDVGRLLHGTMAPRGKRGRRALSHVTSLPQGSVSHAGLPVRLTLKTCSPVLVASRLTRLPTKPLPPKTTSFGLPDACWIIAQTQFQDRFALSFYSESTRAVR